MNALPEQGTVQPKKKFPIAAAVASGAVALASWKSNTDIVRTLAEVRPDSSWVEWAYRWPGSFFEASPYFGKVADTALAVATTAWTFAVTERREGIKRTLKLAAASQFLGCAATRLASAAGLVAPEQRHELDVGPSAVTVALAANYATQRLREHRSPRDALYCQIALGAGAAVLTAIGLTDPNITDLIGHAAGFTYGVVEGTRAPVEPQPAPA